MTEDIITNVKRDTKEGKYIFAVNMKDKVYRLKTEILEVNSK